MSKNSKTVKSAKKNKADRTELIIGVISLLAVMALFVWLIAALSTDSKSAGSITYQGEAVRGRCTTFNCVVDSKMLKDGQQVTWLVDGKKVATTIYNSKEGLSLDYTPTHTGRNRIVAKCADHYCGVRFVDVSAPKLTFEAPTLTVTYGDKLPQMNYKCSGFVDDDCVENMCYDGKCCVDCEGKLEVGSYPITFDKGLSYKDYTSEFVNGRINVQPKKLQLIANLTKVYDQTTEIDIGKYKLKGVLEGDEVYLCTTKLHFHSKDAGANKKLVLNDSMLCGKDAHNYTLDSTINGVITPKHVQLKGLSVQDKKYDGTTKATINQLGRLVGVLPDDNLAIGNIEVSFVKATVGKQGVAVGNTYLVGLDKSNYVLDLPTDIYATITQ